MSEAKSGEHEHTHFQLDRIGIGVSTLCLIHCLTLPILLTFAPFVDVLTDWHQPIHIGIFIMAAPVAFVSLRQGFRHHRKKHILLLGALGCALIFSNIILDFSVDTHLHSFETQYAPWINVVGGFMLATAHFLNLRACRKHSHAAHAHCHGHGHHH